MVRKRQRGKREREGEESGGGGIEQKIRVTDEGGHALRHP
jgi:hypothetical protein